jgi:hypothetical protein
MATMYMMPDCGGLQDDTGWSNTIGGFSNNDTPNTDTDIVLSTGGTPRAIGGGTCKSISNATGFSIDSLDIYGDVVALGGLTSLGELRLFNNSGATTLNAGSTQLTGRLYLGQPVAYTLLSNLTLSGQIQLASGSGSGGALNANGYNVTTSSLLVSNSGVTLSMGSGTWTLTGTGAVWQLGPSGQVVTPGASTIRITDASSTAKSFNSGSFTYNNFRSSATGAGALTIGGTPTFSNFTLDPGATLNLSGMTVTSNLTLGAGSTVRPASGTSITAANFAVDGTASTITISAATAGSRATLAKTGGGTVNFDRCSLKDISGSPAATFRARNSVDAGNNANITFIGVNSQLFSFLF